jgi:hypothetical protein
MKYYLLSIVFLVLAGCKTVVLQDELKQTEALKENLDSIQVEFNALGLADYQELKKISDKDLEELGKTDVTIEDINRVGAYTTMNKEFKRALKKMGGVAEDISYTSKQLDNLLYDLKKNVITDSVIAHQYIHSERVAITNLSMKFLIVKGSLEEYKKVFSTYRDTVLQVIESKK